jgi:hypothetical protein
MVWVLSTGVLFHKPVVPETVAPAYSNDPLAPSGDIFAGEFKAIAEAL